MQAYTVDLYSGISGGSETATIDLGTTELFLAWCQVNMIDSLSDFDSDNAVAIDIIDVDGKRTDSIIHNGAHFGVQGSKANVYVGALKGNGRKITFRLRAFHTQDLAVFGTGIVLIKGE